MNKNLENQLKALFNSVKIDKSKDAAVERTTLISLFQYHQLDTIMPQFYRYICQSLQKLPKITVTQAQFLKILMNPEIDLSTANKEEMADAFSILDVNKNGSIDINEFLDLYRESQNYLLLSETQKKQAQEEIRQAFFSASEDGKITPIDFYHIVKFK